MLTHREQQERKKHQKPGFSGSRFLLRRRRSALPAGHGQRGSSPLAGSKGLRPTAGQGRLAGESRGRGSPVRGAGATGFTEKTRRWVEG